MFVRSRLTIQLACHSFLYHFFLNLFPIRSFNLILFHLLCLLFKLTLSECICGFVFYHWSFIFNYLGTEEERSWTLVVTKFPWKKSYSMGVRYIEECCSCWWEYLNSQKSLFTSHSPIYFLTDLKNYYETWSNRILINFKGEEKERIKILTIQKMCGRLVVTSTSI